MSMKTEKWLPIKGYENIYEVSNYENVRSLSRTTMCKKNIRGGRKSVVGRILAITKNRYCYVSLAKNGKVKTCMIHRLVLNAFVGPAPKGMISRHFPDRNTSNNKLTNLRWGTPKENQHDRIYQGTSRKGIPSTKRTPKIIRDSIRNEYGRIKKYGRSKMTQREVASKYKISLATVNEIIHEK